MTENEKETVDTDEETEGELVRVRDAEPVERLLDKLNDNVMEGEMLCEMECVRFHEFVLDLVVVCDSDGDTEGV